MSTSHPFSVISGVPRGTAFAGILFIWMMKSTDENVAHSSVSSYEDDTKVLHKIRKKTLELSFKGIYN